MINENLVAQRALDIPKSAIHEMTRLSSQMEDVAFLSWAKPTSGVPEHINEATKKAIDLGKTGGYSSTAGLPELREEIVSKLAHKNKITATANEIMITVGAIEGLSAAIMASVNPGDEVIIPVPGYSTHIRQVSMAGGIPILVQTKENDHFSLDLNAIENAISYKTKAIFFSSPNNPTGAVYSKEELMQVAELAQKNNLLVITDEAYEYFTFDQHEHHSIASFDGMHERTISVFTFTKTYAMTGWRIGYLHAPEKWVQQITKMHIPMAICAPVVSQYAALAAIQGEQDCVKDFRQHYRKTRDLMCQRLDNMTDVFEYQKPKGSYLMFPKVKLNEGKDSLTFAKKLLSEAKVSTTPGIAFKGEGHLRMSFCVPEEMINKAFDRMENFFYKI